MGDTDTGTLLGAQLEICLDTLARREAWCRAVARSLPGGRAHKINGLLLSLDAAGREMDRVTRAAGSGMPQLLRALAGVDAALGDCERAVLRAWVSLAVAEAAAERRERAVAA